MKKFRNLITGSVEIVTNKMVIEQYEKHTDRYVEVKAETESKPKDKKSKKDKSE